MNCNAWAANLIFIYSSKRLIQLDSFLLYTVYVQTNILYRFSQVKILEENKYNNDVICLGDERFLVFTNFWIYLLSVCELTKSVFIICVRELLGAAVSANKCL